jgi:tRNA-2-methylthio-N6-dimethylallyladenosine synthase
MVKIINDIEITEVKINDPFTEPSSAVSQVGLGRKLYIESYGCQMNFSDSEIVTSIMNKAGFETTSQINEADVIFINTCSIRERAEQTIRNRLVHFNGLKKKKPDLTVGVLGCMAERLKDKFLDEEKMVDIVVGPDAYRDLPVLVGKAENGQKAVNTLLSREETYADISPVRIDSNGVSAFISIMRGCDNMCSFCVVPFTRGRERSRDPGSIVNEAKDLFCQGYREVTLLGQNVDSYRWTTLKDNSPEENPVQDKVNFAGLLALVAQIHADLRVRFSTSHPKDITDEVLVTMSRFENICKNIHLPAQSGSSAVLERMNRNYDREWYLGRVNAIRSILGSDCGLSSDFISGFCDEKDEEHLETLSLMDQASFDFSFMFAYSERPGTPAAKKMKDNVPDEKKKKRLQEIIDKQNHISLLRNRNDIGKNFKVLVEGYSKRSKDYLQGRNSANKVVIFPKGDVTKGSYVNIKIKDCTSATLYGEVTG